MADRASIVDIVGPVAIGEFDNAKDHYKPGLIEWASKLPTLSDQAFLTECTRAIYESALVSRFRGNWEHEHFKASACYTDAKRRHAAAGHSPECNASTLYGRAHALAMRSAGHTPRPLTGCTCGRESEEKPSG
ncbi:hypothetical protein AB0K34_14185 [Actinomadura sp. NPDC049382]|uniref:hypothetical protein n=1 Tax=Actinomadura sp. NPDC049382 TaxID=3158220 RepID=UPI00342C3608